MTKYEWETELKKNIHRLPSDEINRVLEYYDELFADKIERGYGETEIISQFGNPADVADKIISEYDGETEERKRETVPVYSPSKAREEETRAEKPAEIAAPDSVADKAEAEKEEKPQKEKKTVRKTSGSRLALFVVLNVLTGFALFIVVGAIWIAAGAVIVAGFACIGGGVLETIFSVISVFRGFAGAGFAQCGVCLAAVGIGVIIVSVSGNILKFMFAVTKKLFTVIRNWIRPAEAVHE